MTLQREGLYEDILFHRCRRCGVLWMTCESLDRLDDNINVDASQLDWRRTATTLGYRCLACPGGYREGSPVLTALELAGQPRVVMYSCSTCDGLLLDDRILEQIRATVVSIRG
jgi:hypothetical protein